MSFIGNDKLQNMVQHVQEKGTSHGSGWHLKRCKLSSIQGTLRVFFYHYITDETSFKEKSHLSHVSIYAIALVFYLWVRFYFHNKLLNLSFFVYCIQQHDNVRELMTLLQITQENMTLCCPRQYPNGFYTYVAKLIVKPSQLIVLECLKRHFWQEVFQ